MSASLRVRLLERADLSLADSLRELAGWNQTLEDWERFLSLEPQGCFLAEWNGAPAGTATTVRYGTDLAWIGMMLVHPDYRRRGLGRALMEACLEYLRHSGVRCIKLDATPLGLPVYERLGFKPEWTLTRWQREPPAARPAVAPGIRRWQDAELSSVEALDTQAFGVSRQRLLRLLRGTSLAAVVSESEGRLNGHGMLRRGTRAHYLGPVVAANADVAGAVVEALLGQGNGPVIWDIPDANEAAVRWARRLGFVEQRPLTRMALGEGAVPGLPQLQFAIAGPECG